jgi:hypothetical protein
MVQKTLQMLFVLANNVTWMMFRVYQVKTKKFQLEPRSICVLKKYSLWEAHM